MSLMRINITFAPGEASKVFMVKLFRDIKRSSLKDAKAAVEQLYPESIWRDAYGGEAYFEILTSELGVGRVAHQLIQASRPRETYDGDPLVPRAVINVINLERSGDSLAICIPEEES